MCFVCFFKVKNSNTYLKMSNNNTESTIELMKTFTKRSRKTYMSRYEERLISKKLAANGLEKKYPQLLKTILFEAKQEYTNITQNSSIATKIKFNDLRSFSKLEPYKYLGKTQNYDNYLLKKEQLTKKWILHRKPIRDLLKECILNLPYELFTLNVNGIMELNDFQTLLKGKIIECENELCQFYNRILLMIKHYGDNISENDLNACTGLLSVLLSRSIAHTLLHVVNFTYNKEVPYIKLNITFNDGLILNPTEEQIINIYKTFLNNIINVAKQLKNLNPNKNKTIYLCLTKEFLSNVKGKLNSI